MKKKIGEDYERLGLRIDPELKTRMERAKQRLKEVARKEGKASGDISLKFIAEEALGFYLNYLEEKGDEGILALQEIMAKGTEKTRRTVKACLQAALEDARVSEERRSKQGA